MDQTVIKETISVVSQHVSEADKELGAEFNRVAWLALQQAAVYLRFGPESARLAVTRTMVQSMARLSAIDAKAQIEEHRLAFMRTLRKMSDVPRQDHYAELEAVAGRVDDQVGEP